MRKKSKAKKKPEENKDGRGRKQFDGKNEDIVIQKLEAVWLKGGTDAEAASSAEISPAALSDYLKKNKKISERKAALLERPILKARIAVINAFEDNPELALKYLERKRPIEFSVRTQTELSGKVNNEISADLKTAITKEGFRDIRDLIKSIGKTKSDRKSSMGKNRRIPKSN